MDAWLDTQLDCYLAIKMVDHLEILSESKLETPMVGYLVAKRAAYLVDLLDRQSVAAKVR